MCQNGTHGIYNAHYGAKFLASVDSDGRLHTEHYGTEVYQISDVTGHTRVLRCGTFQSVVSMVFIILFILISVVFRIVLVVFVCLQDVKLMIAQTLLVSTIVLGY